MAATAETLETLEPPVEERYAYSRRFLRSMGEAALAGSVEVQEIIEYQQARADFKSSLREMIVTDPEYRRLLDIDDERHHDIVDSRARDLDGRPMTDIIKAGYHLSAQKADSDRRYQGQADRDKGDLVTSEIVDVLLAGRAYLTISMASRKNLDEHPAIYEKEFGYDRNLAYLQGYVKASDIEVVAFSYSLYITDEAVLYEVLAEHGIKIPAGENYDFWIRHGCEQTADSEEAKAQLLSIRKAYYERIGLTGQRYSVTEFMAAHDEVADLYFDTYYPALGQALVTGENQFQLQGLAQALLKTDIHNLKPELRRQLITIANSEKFDESMGDAMENILRYAVVEDLRPELEVQIKDDRSGLRRSLESQGRGVTGLAASGWLYASPPIDFLNQRLAGSVQRGVQNNRSYSGCAGQVKLSKDGKPEGSLEFNAESQLGERQMAYGGRGTRETSSAGKDKYGDRIFYCKYGHKNVRPKDELLPECQHKGCKAKVACK